MTEENTAGMSTIKFKDGGSLTLPFNQFVRRNDFLVFHIAGKPYSISKAILSHIPEELL